VRRATFATEFADYFRIYALDFRIFNEAFDDEFDDDKVTSASRSIVLAWPQASCRRLAEGNYSGRKVW